MKRYKPKGITYICSMPSCDSEVYAKNLCLSHYDKDHRGTLIRELLISLCECGEPTVRDGILCRKHHKDTYKRKWLQVPGNRERQNAASRRYSRPDDLGPVEPVKEVVGYFQAHKRVKAAKGGPASAFDCVDCGGQAKHWALKHDAVDLLTETLPRRHKDAVVSYSLNPDDYEPKCITDHLNGDRAARSAA